MGGCSEGGFSNNRSVLKPDVAKASEVSILSKTSLAITDFHAKKTQRVQLFENPLPGIPPFAIPQKGFLKSLRSDFVLYKIRILAFKVQTSAAIPSRSPS